MNKSESSIYELLTTVFFQKFFESIHLRCFLYISKQIPNLLLVLIIRTTVSFLLNLFKSPLYHEVYEKFEDCSLITDQNLDKNIYKT